MIFLCLATNIIDIRKQACDIIHFAEVETVKYNLSQ